MITHKVCSKCSMEKPVSEFGIANPNKDGFNSWCKQCVRNSSKKWRETPQGIYSAIKGRQRYNTTQSNRRQKPFLITMGDFIEWYENEPKTCHYCDLPEKFIHLIDEHQLNKTHRLTIDCVKNKVGYINGNLVLACGRCNYIKSDYFTYDEYVKLAQEVIKPKWKQAIKIRLEEQ